MPGRAFFFPAGASAIMNGKLTGVFTQTLIKLIMHTDLAGHLTPIHRIHVYILSPVNSP